MLPRLAGWARDVPDRVSAPSSWFYEVSAGMRSNTGCVETWSPTVSVVFDLTKNCPEGLPAPARRSVGPPVASSSATSRVRACRDARRQRDLVDPPATFLRFGVITSVCGVPLSDTVSAMSYGNGSWLPPDRRSRSFLDQGNTRVSLSWLPRICPRQVGDKDVADRAVSPIHHVMSRWLVVLRSHRVLIPLALLVVLACVAVTVVGIRERDVNGHAEPNGRTMTARFGRSGVDLTLGGLTVRGPAGAAPDGTVLAASTSPNQSAANLASVTTGIGGGVSLSLGGRKPTTPMQLTLHATAAPSPGAAAVLITVPSDGSQPRLIPATYSPSTHTITASFDHFGWFWPGFLSFGSPTMKVTVFLTQTTGLFTARPACVGRSASANGVTITLPDNYGSNTRPAAWPRVTIDESTVSVELTSDLSLRWRVRAVPNGTPQAEGMTDPDAVVLLAAYQTLVDEAPLRGGPAGSKRDHHLPLGRDSLPGTVQGRVDVGTYGHGPVVRARRSDRGLWHQSQRHPGRCGTRPLSGQRGHRSITGQKAECRGHGRTSQGRAVLHRTGGQGQLVSYRTQMREFSR